MLNKHPLLKVGSIILIVLASLETLLYLLCLVVFSTLQSEIMDELDLSEYYTEYGSEAITILKVAFVIFVFIGILQIVTGIIGVACKKSTIAVKILGILYVIWQLLLLIGVTNSGEGSAIFFEFVYFAVGVLYVIGAFLTKKDYTGVGYAQPIGAQGMGQMPYGQPNLPYGDANQMPYGQPVDQFGQPLNQLGQATQYSQPQDSAQFASYSQAPSQNQANPYGQAPSQNRANPYSQAPSQNQANPYGQAPSQNQANPYGQPADSADSQPDPYQQNPYSNL